MLTRCPVGWQARMSRGEVFSGVCSFIEGLQAISQACKQITSPIYCSVFICCIIFIVSIQSVRCVNCVCTEVRMFRMASIFDFTVVLSYKSQHIKELLSSGVMWFDRTDRRPQCVTRLHCYRPIACRAIGQRARPISSLLLLCVQCVSCRQIVLRCSIVTR